MTHTETQLKIEGQTYYINQMRAMCVELDPSLPNYESLINRLEAGMERCKGKIQELIESRN